MKRILLIILLIFTFPLITSANAPTKEIIVATRIYSGADGNYYDSKGNTYTKEDVKAMLEKKKKEQEKKDLFYADIAGLALFLLIATWAFADWNSRFSKVVFGHMFRYISIVISGLALCALFYDIVTQKSSRNWQEIVFTIIVFINLLALLKLDTSAKSISSYLSTFMRRKQIENEMKTLEAEKKLDELRK